MRYSRVRGLERCVCRARKRGRRKRGRGYSIDLVTSERGCGAEEGARSEWE